LCVCLVLSACDAPRDPDGATERIARTHVIRVGVSENAPWVRFEAGQPIGIEPALVRRFAAANHAQVEWVRNAEAPLMKALHQRELDLVVGGLQSDTPWKAKVGVSKPYTQARWIVAVRAGAPKPASVRGMRIAAPPGSEVAAKLRAKGAIPVAPGVGAPWQAAAVYDFEAAQTNLAATDIRLLREKHVIAVAPGENQLLLRLDRFLAANKGSEESQSGGAQG
jgi:hypothetical protein